MDFTDISANRLQNQQLSRPVFKDIAGLVSHFGAIQAQDYAMAKWAIGARMPGISEADVDEAINSAAIVRTHVLRPTWHFAAAEDIHWMLGLTAKSIRRQSASNDKKLGLDEATYIKSFKLIEKALRDDHLTRAELMEILKFSRINTSEYRSRHIMAAAELESLVVSGRRKEKEHTYALLDERVKKSRRLTREEALCELANTYFTSHGPATIRDFHWWSGLNLTDCRAAIAANEKRLQLVDLEGRQYFFSEEVKSKAVASVHLLPAFDEFLISYKDRSASIDIAHQKHAFTMNGIFKPIIVVDGQVCGIWKRSVKKDTVLIEATFLNKVPKSRYREVEEQAHLFAQFLGLKVQLVCK